MRDRPDRHWLSRRLAASRPAGPALRPGFARLRVPATMPDPLASLKAEPPAADGVRHALVARVRQLIANGEYDTPERWRAAERRLLGRAEAAG